MPYLRRVVLDLVLKAFAQMHNVHLTICGSISQEEYFVKAFYQELYQTPNIHTMGWIDVNSQNFINIFNSCVGIVYPCCSEGEGGSVINCMHAGLIPIVQLSSECRRTRRLWCHFERQFHKTNQARSPNNFLPL